MLEKQKIKDNNKISNFYLFKSVSLEDKYNFYEYLWVMIDSWVILSEALKSVDTKIKNVYFSQRIQELITYIDSWDSFSKALKKIPDIFTSKETSIIEAWETVWWLSDSMIKLSENLRKKSELVSKVKSALTYPFIIFLFLLLAVIVILTYVIPKIRTLFDNSWVELPLSTRALIFTSDMLVNNYFIIILILIFIWVLFLWYKTTLSWKKSMDHLKLSLPLIWRVYKSYILSQVASTLWILVGSWVPIIKSLNLVWKSTNNLIYENIFKYITIKVSKWQKIVDSIGEVDKDNIYFSTDFVQMLSVWEKTANIEWISEKINKQYSKEVDYALANLTKWIEPLAILIAWLFVAWFAFAVLSAILKVTETVW